MARSSRAPLYIRNFIFGVEDSLVSTVGLLSGLASQQVPHGTLLLTGVVYIFVEGFSMAVGSFLSEESAEEYASKRRISNRLPILGSIIMFASFIFAGLVPIVPYLMFEGSEAIYASVGFSLAVLFCLGFVGSRGRTIKLWRRGLRMLVLGGLAIAIGIIVGKFFQIG